MLKKMYIVTTQQGEHFLTETPKKDNAQALRVSEGSLMSVNLQNYLAAKEVDELVEVSFNQNITTIVNIKHEEQVIYEMYEQLMDRAKALAMGRVVVSTFRSLMPAQGK